LKLQVEGSVITHDDKNMRRDSEKNRIIGIDPGSLLTGFAVLQPNAKWPWGDLMTAGVIKMPTTEEFSRRIHLLGQEFSQVLKKYPCGALALEKIFLGKNPHSAFQLGHARGVIIYEACRAGLEIYEYSTRQVKKGITGSGAADKVAVSQVLKRWFGVSEFVTADASDAAALAVYHLQNQYQWRSSQTKEISI
jgi:crossover junction endodeoxyribonuclease RuvC